MPIDSYRRIEATPGVQTTADFTQQSTPHFTASDKIRFVDGYPEKIGGWVRTSFDDGSDINGCTRSIFSYLLSNNARYIFGTHTHLYHLFGTNLTNITPLETTGTGLTDVLSTTFGTLAANPFSATNTSTTVTVTDSTGAALLANGDRVQFSGAVGFAGIPPGDLNAAHVVSNVVTNVSYDIVVDTAATSTATGGGGAVSRATRFITITDANDFLNGDTISISGVAAPVGGIPEASINGIHRIRNVTTSDYVIDAGSFATSSVSGTGGGITIFEQIPEGLCDPTTGVGYGLGLYGAGLYGVPKSSSTASLPRIWSSDRFGDLVITTAGNQTGLYSWNSSTATLPELVANAPTAINYAFTSNEIAVTLGASNTDNRIQWSDQGNLTTWTGTAENQAGQDDIEGASRFLSHASLRGFNLLFTREAVYTFRYIGRPFVWETRLLDAERGLIAQNARIVVNGIAYWMGSDNFYYYRGGNVEIIPSNSTTQTTLKKQVFQNLNSSQSSKSFCWYNDRFDEIWWHYPSGASSEPNAVARFNIRDFTWVPDTIDRSAGEYPGTKGEFPYMAQSLSGSTSAAYQHERGANDDTQPLAFSLTTPSYFSGSNYINLEGLFPDSIQTGDITMSVTSKRYPQDTSQPGITSTITPTTDKLSYRVKARYWQYTISGNVLNQTWRGGDWYELLKGGTPL